LVMVEATRQIGDQASMERRYTYCLSRGNVFDDKQLRVE
jgi:hypothetical protein